MKKALLIGLMSILLGFILGNIIFSHRGIYLNTRNQEKYYFLQEGTYYKKDSINSNQINLKQKIVEYNNDKIIIYVGITKSLEVAEKLINIYAEKNINLSIKEIYYDNEEFKNNVEQLDFLISESKDKNEILTIEEVVLANYEEIVKKH